MRFKDMPLDTTLQKGDIVTITGPGEHDVLVREVTGLDAFDNSAIVAGMVGPTADMVVILGREGRTLSRVQRPVPALPTVEGDYIVKRPNGYREAASLRGGVWLDPWGAVHVMWLADRVEDGSNFTRVIPADEVKYPEADIAAAVQEFQCAAGGSYELDFVSILRRALEGELDR